MTILDRILEAKINEVADLKDQTPIDVLKEAIRMLPPTRNFRDAISGKDCAIIAEVKRKSPSKGLLINGFDPVRIASVYEENGAAAISVLTDNEFFGGDKGYLTSIKTAVNLPLLRKDFIIDPYQIYETRILGADAVLLIAALLEENQLNDFIHLADSLGLSPLVEVHNEDDLAKALACDAKTIGINNRDLNTFITDLKTSMELMAIMPRDKIVISESGITNREAIDKLVNIGIHAFLVGESLMTAANPACKLRELLNK